jgi:hypothetical protein
MLGRLPRATAAQAWRACVECTARAARHASLAPRPFTSRTPPPQALRPPPPPLPPQQPPARRAAAAPQLPARTDPRQQRAARAWRPRGGTRTRRCRLRGRVRRPPWLPAPPAARGPGGCGSRARPATRCSCKGAARRGARVSAGRACKCEHARAQQARPTHMSAARTTGASPASASQAYRSARARTSYCFSRSSRYASAASRAAPGGGSRYAAPHTAAPGAPSRSSVTTRPGAPGVPRWSVLPWWKTRRQPRAHSGAARATCAIPSARHTSEP